MEKKKIDVMAISRLARLDFNADERQRLEREMEQFDEFADCLRVFCDSADVECEISQPVAIFREDEGRVSEISEELISLSSGAKDGYISVPITVDKEGGK